MDFRTTDDQATLVESVRDYLAGTHGPDMLRALDAGGDERPDAVWSDLVEMGLPGLLVAEAQGGLGMGLFDAVLIATELGRAGVAAPLADTAFVAAPVLAETNGQEALLAAITTGQARIALQHPLNPWVTDLDRATHLLVADGAGLRLAARDGAAVESMESVDPLRRLAAPVVVAGKPIAGQADALLDHAALMTASQLVGLADGMLAISIAYATTRSQFGQPIGGFQAIKHHLATAAVKIEFAKPVLQRAAAALAAGAASAPIHVSHAKLAAADAATAMAETAIQVHGAMGYTYEVDLHFWMKRAWALAGAWGDRAFHLRRVDAGIIGGALPIGPACTFA